MSIRKRGRDDGDDREGEAKRAKSSPNKPDRPRALNPRAGPGPREHRVLVTGYRFWVDHAVIESALKRVEEAHPDDALVLIHGAALGADTMAAAIAQRRNWAVISVPAEWAKYGKKAGPIRNKRMVTDFYANEAIAFVHPNSRGTLDCIEHVKEHMKLPHSRLKELRVYTCGMDGKVPVERVPEDMKKEKTAE